MWYAAGNPSSYEMAAHKGLGVLGFSVGDFASAEKAVSSYKKAVADAEPIGAFVNDNLMCCIAAYVADSLMLVTALNPHIGYDKAAAIAKNTRALVRKQLTWFRTQLPPHLVRPAPSLCSVRPPRSPHRQGSPAIEPRGTSRAALIHHDDVVVAVDARESARIARVQIRGRLPGAASASPDPPEARPPEGRNPRGHPG